MSRNRTLPPNSVKGFALLFLAVSFLGSPSLTGQDISTAHIPSSAFAMMGMRPKSALAQPSMELVPRELIKVFGEKELGLDLLELSQVTMVMAPFNPEMQEVPDFGVMVRFDTPQTFGAKALENMQPMEFEGLKAFNFSGGDSGIVVMLDEKTMLIGKDSYLKQMLNAQGASSQLINRIKSGSATDHLYGHVMIEPIRAMIKSNLPPMEQVPPPFRDLLKIPDLIESISFRSDYSNGDDTELRVMAINDAAAIELNKIIGHGIEMGKTMGLSALATQMEISDEDYQNAIIQYSERLVEAIKKQLLPAPNGRELVYKLDAAAGGGSASLATIGVLTGMLLPAVQQVREAARRTSAANTLRQFALASHNYESAHMHFPMQANYDANGKPLLSWRVHILPYIEENALYQQFKLDEPWDSPHNIQLLDKMPAIYRSPNNPMPMRTPFLAVAGPGTTFPGNKKISFGNITDGSSNTIMFVEADSVAAVEWTRPVDLQFDPSNPMMNLGNDRPGGFNAAMGDGSVRFISNSVDPEMLSSAFTINDGKITDLD